LLKSKSHKWNQGDPNEKGKCFQVHPEMYNTVVYLVCFDKEK
jgi:hypothetical protein